MSNTEQSHPADNLRVALPLPDSHDPSQNGSSDVFARDLLVALQRFKDGDFSVRLPSDLVGVEGKVADVFNEILAVSSRRWAESARVCRMVGKEGKLKERMRVPSAVGGWDDEITELNTLIDDLVWPTTEVTRTVGAVAKGDLSQAMNRQLDHMVRLIDDLLEAGFDHHLVKPVAVAELDRVLQLADVPRE